MSVVVLHNSHIDKGYHINLYTYISFKVHIQSENSSVIIMTMEDFVKISWQKGDMEDFPFVPYLYTAQITIFYRKLLFYIPPKPSVVLHDVLFILFTIFI